MELAAGLADGAIEGHMLRNRTVLFVEAAIAGMAREGQLVERQAAEGRPDGDRR